MIDDKFDESAEAAARAFEIAGERIEQALTKAAKTGELSFKDMAESVLEDLARIAVQELVTDPLSNFLGGALGGLGGALGGGNASGSSGQNVNITMNVAGGSDSGGLRQSLGQISSSLGRAVTDSQRYL